MNKKFHKIILDQIVSELEAKGLDLKNLGAAERLVYRALPKFFMELARRYFRLEVEGLGNLPGVHSARYAGPKAADSENTAKLLKMMQIRAVANRNAQFQCALVVYTPTGEEWIFNGQLKGQIAKAPAGQHGFGYDPVFIPEGETKTLAEIGSGYKSKHSHRAHATMQFIEKLKAL